jgi:chromosome segregation ATPase
MELLLEMLRSIAQAVAPAEFLTILTLIAVISGMAIFMFAKHVRSKSGAWSFLDAPEEDKIDLSDIDESIKKVLVELKSKHVEIEQRHADILAEIKELRQEDLERLNAIFTYLEKLESYETMLSNLKEDMKNHFDALTEQFGLHGSNESTLHATTLNTVQAAIKIIEKIDSDIKSLDIFTKNSIVDFKNTHKDLSKDLATLSKDVALVERSVQSQIAVANAVKLQANHL